MKQKEQQLLLKELCARSPYGVKVVYLATTYSIQYVDSKFDEVKLEGMPHTVGISHIKPYLRPMSSMTEDEIEELKELCSIYLPCDKPMMFEDYGIIVFTHHIIYDSYSFKFDSKVVNWLLAHHFDFRCLIEKGLAIEVTEENNPYKE